MFNSDSYKRIMIVSGWLTIMFFCCIFLLPMVLRHRIDDKISDISVITSDRFLLWGQSPSRDPSGNISTFKDFNVFSYQGQQDNKIKTNISSNFTYEYKSQYKNLTYLPNTDDSIAYSQLYSHQNLFNEDTMKNYKFNQINIGLLHGYYEEVNKPLEQQIGQSLFSLVRVIKEDFLPKYFAHSLFFFYIQNQQLTYSSILRKADILDQTTADAVWNDQNYGWGKWETLSFWLPMVLSTNFNSHSNWQTLKNHFSLTDVQMNSIVGPKSLFNDLILVIQGAISDKNGCAGNSCTDDELVALQWCSESLTKNPVLDGIPVVNSVIFYNNTLPFGPEISKIYNSSIPQTISSSVARNLLSYSGNGDINSAAISLLNYTNIKYVLDHASAPNFTRAFFEFNTVQEAIYVQEYLDYLSQNFILRKSEVSLSNPESLAISNLAKKAFNTAYSQIQDMLLTTMNNKAILKNLEDTKQDCSVLLNDIQPEETKQICSNANFSLTTEASINYWTSIIYLGRSSSSWSELKSQTSLSDATIEFLTGGKSKLRTLYSNINSQISTFYKCKNPTWCDKSELAIIQWASGNITRTLPSDLFNDSDRTETINSWSTIFAKNEYPEFSYLMFKQYNKNFTLTAQSLNNLLSYNKGGLLNSLELDLFYYYLAVNNLDDIKTRFGLDSEDANKIMKYLNRLVVDYVFGGTFIETNGYDLVWGYPDSYKAYLAKLAPLEGGLPLDDTLLNLRSKTNQKEWSNLKIDSFNVMNTGLKNSDKVRAIKSYQGSKNISVIHRWANGRFLNTSYTTVSNPWNKNISIEGTDGTGFKPDLDDDSSNDLSVFSPFLYRVLKLDNTRTFIDDSGYEYFDLKISSNNISPNKDFDTRVSGTINLTSGLRLPVMATFPFYGQVDSAYYKNITVNGSSFDVFNQASDNSGLIRVEKNTGFTAKKKVGFQYSLYVPDIMLLDDSYDIKQNQLYPLFIETEYFEFNNARADSIFKDVYDKFHVKKVCLWVCVGFAIFFFVILLVSGIFYFRKRGEITGNSAPLLG